MSGARRRAGVTLVEILVAVSLAAAVVGTAVFAFLTFFGVSRGVQEEQEARLAERRLFLKLEEDLRAARRVETRGGTLALLRPPGAAEGATGEVALLRVEYAAAGHAVTRTEGAAATAYEFFAPAREGAALTLLFETEPGRCRVRLRVKPGETAAPFESSRDFGLPSATPESDGWRGIGGEGR